MTITNKDILDKVRKFYKDGYSIQRIANEIKIAVGTVYYMLSKMNIPLRKSRGRKEKMFTEKEIENIRKLYEEEGYSGRDIAKIISSSDRKVYQLLKNINAVKKGMFTKDQLKQIKHLYTEEAYLINEIAKEYKTTSPTIIRVLKKMGVEINTNPRTKFTDKEVERIIETYDQGHSSCEIATNCDISANYVLQLVKKSGKIIR